MLALTLFAIIKRQTAILAHSDCLYQRFQSLSQKQWPVFIQTTTSVENLRMEIMLVLNSDNISIETRKEAAKALDLLSSYSLVL